MEKTKEKIDLSIAIPTYNEKDNVKILIQKLEKEFSENNIKGEVVFVDDNSPDGTGKILEDLKEENSFVRVIHRKGKEGLSSAVVEGWKNSTGNVLGVMDADLSHPVEKIPEMLEETKKGSDLVVGSRYISGGGIRGWNFKRKVMSKFATFLAKPFTKIKDPMSGFFFVKKDKLNFSKIDSKGFKILLEVAVKSDIKKIKEIPITFTDRQKGKSKANSKEIFCYLKNLWNYVFDETVFGEALKFGLVGVSGMLVNLGILYILTEFAGFFYLVSGFVAFLIAVSWNFSFNKVWTFKESYKHKTTLKFFKFLLVSSGGLVVNLLFLWFFTEIIGTYYMVSQVLAIGIAFIVNFIGNKIWTFRK